jgi:hypothetical protein
MYVESGAVVITGVVAGVRAGIYAGAGVCASWVVQVAMFKVGVIQVGFPSWSGQVGVVKKLVCSKSWCAGRGAVNFLVSII